MICMMIQKDQINKTFNLQFQNEVNESTKYVTIGSVTAEKGKWAKIEGDYRIPKRDIVTKYAMDIEMAYKPKDQTEDSDKVDFYIDGVTVEKCDMPEKDFQRNLKSISDNIKITFQQEQGLIQINYMMIFIQNLLHINIMLQLVETA